MMQQRAAPGGFDAMSDEELLAMLERQQSEPVRIGGQDLQKYVEAGGQFQPTNAATGQPLPNAQAQAYGQLSAAGGLDPTAIPGSPRLPRAMVPGGQPEGGEFYVSEDGRILQAPVRSDVGDLNLANLRMSNRGFEVSENPGPVVPGGAGNAVRALARGIPVAGPYLDEANAGTQALLAPLVEPAMRQLERWGMDTGYDPRLRLDDKPTFEGRFRDALGLQGLTDAAYDEQHPGMSGTLRGVGMVGGTIAGLRALTPISGALGAEAGILPRMGAGAVEGGVLGGVHGYGEGIADLDDPRRLGQALDVGMLGTLGGAAAPLAFKAGEKALGSVSSRVRDALGGPREVAPPSTAQEIAAALSKGEVELPPALRSAGEADDLQRSIAEVMAARASTPAATVPPSAEADAYARIARAMARQRQTPDQLVTSVRELGPMGMMADTGDAMRNLARDALNRPSGAEDIIRKALDARQKGIYEPMEGGFAVRPSSLRILDDAASGLGVEGRTMSADLKALSEAQREAAEPLYAQVRELGATYSPTLNALEQRPSVKRAKVRAYRLAKEEGRNPEALGLAEVEIPGAFDSEAAAVAAAPAKALRAPAKAPSQGKSLAKFVADGGGVTDTGGDLAAMGAGEWHKRRAFQKGLIGKGGGADDWAVRAWEAGYFPGDAPPSAQQLLAAVDRELRGKPTYARAADEGAAQRYGAREAADEAAYRGGTEPPPSPEDYVGRPAPEFEMAWQVEPTAETWDYIKRGLDDELTPYREGKKAWDSEGRAILRTLNELRGELVNLNPVYGEALDAWSGPAAMKDALEAGRKFAREDADALGERFADMPPGERRMYRVGVVQGLKDKLGGSDVTSDAARLAGLLKPNQLERFREMFPRANAFASFVKSLEAEQRMFQTRSAVLGNSTTAKQLLAAQDNDESALRQTVAAAVAAKTGNLPALTGALWRAGGQPRMPETTSEAIATILSNMDASALGVARGRLTEAQAAQALADEIRRATVTAGSQAAGAAAPPRK